MPRRLPGVNEVFNGPSPRLQRPSPNAIPARRTGPGCRLFLAHHGVAYSTVCRGRTTACVTASAVMRRSGVGLASVLAAPLMWVKEKKDA